MTKKISLVLSFIMVFSLLFQNVAFADVMIESNGDVINEKEDVNYVYELKDENIVDSGEGTKYVNNIIKIYFNNGVSEERKNEIIDSIDGKIVGEISKLDQYQVQIGETSIDKIGELADNLINNYNEVLYAGCDYVTDNNQLAVYPDDPYEGATWDEENPADQNWAFEAIEMPSAWEYNNKLNDTSIKIGVVENGYYTSHEDFPDDYEIFDESNGNIDGKNHGTGVVGTIAAKSNNGIGVSGIVWNPGKMLLGINDSQNWTSSSVSLFTRLVENGAKVINLSLFAGIYGEEAALIIAKLVNNGYDFIAVQAAGNIPEEDSQYNGLFCTITDEIAEKVASETGLTAEDITGRKICVAASTKTESGYCYAGFSSVGETVDIAAPGKKVYTTGDNNTYYYAEGTSFATPIVTGITTLVWRANTKLTGPEVKSIVCNNKNTKYKVGPSSGDPTVPTTRMVNAKLAIEDAINSKNQNSVVIYYKGYDNPYIHYMIGNESWTKVPGLKMQVSDERDGYNYKAVIDLGDSESVTLCFNNGKGLWDSNNGSNYVLTKGVYEYSNGVFKKISDGTINKDESLKIKSFTASSSGEVEEGTPVTLKAEVENAVGNVTYTFSQSKQSSKELPILALNSSDNSIVWKDSGVGIYNLRVIARDEAGNEATKIIFKYKVVEEKPVDPLSVTVSYDENSDITSGVKVPMTINISGGRADYKYNVYAKNNSYSSEQVVSGSTSGSNTIYWTPSSDGNWIIYFEITDAKGNIATISKNINVSKAKDNITTIYYKGYDNPYIHYNIGGTWTSTPGIKMIPCTDVEGYNYKLEIDLGEETSLIACFNDGNGNWDSNGGKNYTFEAGTYGYSNGSIVPVNDEINIQSFYCYNDQYNYVGGNVEFRMAASSKGRNVYYTLTATKDGKSEIIHGPDTCEGKCLWWPKEAGEYLLTLTVKDSDGNVATRTMNFTVPGNEENQITVYYKGYDNPYMHYKIGNGAWTTAPGIKMVPTNEMDGYTHKLTIDLADSDNLTACFNNGKGSWDSNNGANYYFSQAGTYTYSNGTINKLSN